MWNYEYGLQLTHSEYNYIFLYMNIHKRWFGMISSCTPYMLLLIVTWAKQLYIIVDIVLSQCAFLWTISLFGREVRKNIMASALNQVYLTYSYWIADTISDQCLGPICMYYSMCVMKEHSNIKFYKTRYVQFLILANP